MKVLSLFDGMSCGQLALTRANIAYSKYYASEIDKHAIKVTQSNFPNTIQVGDVSKLKASKKAHVDLFIGGSPCQGFSYSGKQLNFNDPRSMLFYEYVRLLRELTPTYFLLENVLMKQEYIDIISEQLQATPIRIDSSLVSAQSRERLYWTNIPVIELPKNKYIYLEDILESEVDDAYLLHNTYTLKTQYTGKSRLDLLFENYRVKHNVKQNKPVLVSEIVDDTPSGRSRQSDRLYSSLSKSPTLVAIRSKDMKIDCGSHNKDMWRNITPIEAERLQTVPDGYTSSVSDPQRYKMLGNGWTVDVIAHILKGIK